MGSKDVPGRDAPPPATYPADDSVTIKHDGKTVENLKQGARATAWGLKHFQWYLTILAVVVLGAISISTNYIHGVGRNTTAMLSTLEIKESSVTKVLTAAEWLIAATWILAGIAMLMTVFAALDKFVSLRRREHFDNVVATGEVDSKRTWRACVGFNFARGLLNTVHVLVILTACWFVVLLCAFVTCTALFLFLEKATTGAVKTVQNAETGTNALVGNFTEWIEVHGSGLTEVSDTLNAQCANVTVACPEWLDEPLQVLTELSRRTVEVQAELLAAESTTCESNSCINLDQIWFLEASGCMCASETISAVSVDAIDAKKNSFWASVWLAVSLFATLLMVSKTAMNLKSLLKDEHWIARMRRVFTRLADRGVLLTSDDSALLHSSSSAAHFQSLACAALPSDTPPPPVRDSGLTASTTGVSVTAKVDDSPQDPLSQKAVPRP